MTATPEARPCASRAKQRGSALILVPAMLLVFLALGSIAVDLSIVHMANRSAQRIIAAAADDAAGMIDSRQIQIDGSIRIDPAAAREVALAHIAAAELPGDLRGPVIVTVGDSGSTVTVSITLAVSHVFMQSIPGASGSELLSLSASARVLR